MKHLVILLGLLCTPLLNHAQSSSNTFTETQKDTAKTPASEIPFFRLSGIASLSDLAGLGEPGATGKVLGEFNLFDTPKKPGLVNFSLEYNIGADLTIQDRDSVPLANMFIQDKSRQAFQAGLSFDLLRIGRVADRDGAGKKIRPTGATWQSRNAARRAMRSARPLRAGTMDRVQIATRGGKQGQTYFRITPSLDYAYSGWRLKSAVIGADTVNPDTSFVIDRIQTSQWFFGFKMWYTVIRDDNTFGIQLYPFVRTQIVSDATYPEFSEIFRGAAANGTEVPQHLDFWGVTLGLQLNKFRVSFTYHDLLNAKSITDRNVTGGVFLISVSTIANFIDF